MAAIRCSFAVAALAVVATSQEGKVWQERRARIGISAHDAVARALLECPGGVVFHIELEPDGARLVWSVDVARGHASTNVIVDAATQAVVEKADEHDDVAELVAAATIDIRRALTVATEHGHGLHIEAQLRLEGGAPVYVVRAPRDGAIETVRVDAKTGTVLGAAPPPASQDEPFTDTFLVERTELRSTGRNPFFVLEPGYRLVLAGKDGADDVRLEITVLDETITIDGVETRIVEERETENGELIEVSRNFFAISTRTNDVYYFGEDVDMYEDGKVKSHDGAWRSGVAGARFGLLMPGSPLLGARYYQEVAPGVAMDRARVLGLSGEASTPAGRFAGCLTTEESTPLEPGVETKTYANGIGLVQEQKLLLVEHGRR